MKENSSGWVGAPDSGVPGPNAGLWAKGRAVEDYIRERWQAYGGREDGFPRDGCFTKNGILEGREYVWEYTEGPRDKAFMEAKDRKYLRELATTDPSLFLKELTPRGELSAAEQRRELGLDLSSPHHRNLQREFRELAELIRKEEREHAAAAKAAADVAAAAETRMRAEAEARAWQEAQARAWHEARVRAERVWDEAQEAVDRETALTKAREAERRETEERIRRETEIRHQQEIAAKIKEAEDKACREAEERIRVETEARMLVYNFIN